MPRLPSRANSVHAGKVVDKTHMRLTTKLSRRNRPVAIHGGSRPCGGACGWGYDVLGSVCAR
eukprot:5193351-Prymnesium_polylepis.1